MYNLVPFILIITSLVVILVIVGRKFSVLAALDVDSIPEVKENKFKEQIISNRLKRNILKWTSRLRLFLANLKQKINNFLSSFYNKLLTTKEEYQAELKPQKEVLDIETKIEKLLKEAENLKKEEDYQAAEKKLIEVIKLDSKNLAAFKLLGEIYFANRQFKEARETFAHILRLQASGEEEKGFFTPQEKEDFSASAAQIYYNLALVEKALENLEAAVKNLAQALDLEPNNPRYLDTMIEISILNNDKVKAEKFLSQLKKVNPENQKLVVLEEKINAL